jgi:hypothetical protein
MLIVNKYKRWSSKKLVNTIKERPMFPINKVILNFLSQLNLSKLKMRSIRILNLQVFDEIKYEHHRDSYKKDGQVKRVLNETNFI